MGEVLHLVQRGVPGRAADPPRPLLAVPNVTAHPSPINGHTNFILFDVQRVKHTSNWPSRPDETPAICQGSIQ